MNVWKCPTCTDQEMTFEQAEVHTLIKHGLKTPCLLGNRKIEFMAKINGFTVRIFAIEIKTPKGGLKLYNCQIV